MDLQASSLKCDLQAKSARTWSDRRSGRLKPHRHRRDSRSERLERNHTGQVRLRKNSFHSPIPLAFLWSWRWLAVGIPKCGPWHEGTGLHSSRLPWRCRTCEVSPERSSHGLLFKWLPSQLKSMCCWQTGFCPAIEWSIQSFWCSMANKEHLIASLRATSPIQIDDQGTLCKQACCGL